MRLVACGLIDSDRGGPPNEELQADEAYAHPDRRSPCSRFPVFGATFGLGAALKFGTAFQRRVVGFFLRPVFPFVLELVVLAPLVVAFDQPGVGPLYLMASPWILLGVGVLNIPFVMQVFRCFQMDHATRQNHALEHATVLLLREKTAQRLGGRASSDGFRISGGADTDTIREAFAEVRRRVREGEALNHISRHCGSNRVTALGLAMAMLLVFSLLCVLLHPPLWLRVTGLSVVVLAFILLRHSVGDWIQGRFFMATDFRDALVRSVRKVKADHVIENPPAFFVKTRVVEE